MMEILAIIILLGGCFLVAWLICTAINAIFEHKELKKRKAHPQFYSWIAELNELTRQSVKYYNQHIAPLKRLVDDILKEWEYYDKEMRFHKSADLELYRMNIQRHQRMLNSMRDKEKHLCEVIRKYNAEHHLEGDNW